MTGRGLIWMLKVWGGPVQPFSVARTVTTPICGAATLGAVKAMLPIPIAARPTAGLVLVQVNSGAVPGAEKLTATGSPEQAATSGGSATAGEGLTVRLKVVGVPGQPLAPCGVTVMAAT